MIALIDSDIVAYRCAASAENEPAEVALLRVDSLMREIIEVTGSSSYKSFLSDSKTFRNELYPFYKANRIQPKPKYLKICKEFLVAQWRSVSQSKLEADDLLGINQSNETIICSIDKDLLQVPGQHYNFVKKEFTTVTEQLGLFNFYYQLLVGDRTDNISGVDGIGDKKARRLLEGCTTEDEYFDTVREAYNNDDLMYLYGRLLWILREEGGIWNPKQIEKLSLGQSQLLHEAEVESAYTEMLTITE